jgi:undecaprenyl diphosphate synthase
MDGNGRWAQSRGQSRLAGHRQGLEAIKRVIRAAPGLAVTDLTLYAFSTDNWSRPADETAGILSLLAEFAASEAAELARNQTRLTFIGRRDRLPALVGTAMLAAEVATVAGKRMRLRVAVDYSSRDALLEAAQARPRTREEFERLLSIPPVDLLIRTGGEQRLSDFLLWECAYAEFHFSPKLWPDVSAQDLAAALADFHRRTRRFGSVPA